ncbi:MAG: hypothetical protein R3F16_13585 [Myxococcota bacterium]
MRNRSRRSAGRAAVRLGAGLCMVLMVGTPGLPSGGGTARAQELEGERGPMPTLEITPGGVTAFKAAVLRFQMVGPPVGEERVETLREEIERALVFSGVVVPLDHAAYLGPDQSPPLEGEERLDCESWRSSGADSVVQGEVRREGERLRADLRIWDVARCRTLETGRVVGDRDRLERLGRLVGDEIVEALTGTRGVASTEIAFISDRTGHRELYVMSADGRDQRPATRSDALKMAPEWLPDGKGVLYVAYDGVQPGFFLTARSAEITPGPILAHVMRGRPKYRGRFDPTGQELAFVSSVDGAAELYLVQRRGGEVRRLTDHPALDLSPAWSPDGREIVFVSDRSGSPQLYLMKRDGSDLRRLTYTGSYNASPAWSPDGRWIAYETRVRGQFDIWLIDPSGQINFPIIQHALSDEGPSWSPDSRKLVFSSSRRGRYDLYVADWNGQNVQRLTGRSGTNIQPAWGPQAR